jgi:hypothetical protein
VCQNSEDKKGKAEIKEERPPGLKAKPGNKLSSFSRAAVGSTIGGCHTLII